jgi:hypothetical protein
MSQSGNPFYVEYRRIELLPKMHDFVLLNLGENPYALSQVDRNAVVDE